jgi:glutamyl-tRNA reductase
MHLFLLGLSHKTAPIEVRERLSISPAQLPRALNALRESGGASESAILSTCNRTEIYAVGPSQVGHQLERFAGQLHLAHGGAPLKLCDWYSCSYRTKDATTARHLFRVASGVESLILGESEILGQVKKAREMSQAQGTLGAALDELFRRAISCGKRARAETEIGRGAQSVGTAAVELSRQIFGSLKGRTVLILGAGKISALTARALVACGAHEVIVANRTHQRAQELAATLCSAGADAEATRWDELPRRLVEADIVIASTHAPHTVLSVAQVDTAMRARRHRPLFLIDLAMPRDIEAGAHELDDVFLYDIDDLKNVVGSNRSQRECEVELVQNIIETEVESWQKWQRSLDARPVMAALAGRGEEIREAELESALSKLSHLSDKEKEVVRRLSQSLTGKILHAPLRHLREAGETGSSDVEAIRRAFALGESPQNQSQRNAEEVP